MSVAERARGTVVRSDSLQVGMPGCPDRIGSMGSSDDAGLRRARAMQAQIRARDEVLEHTRARGVIGTQTDRDAHIEALRLACMGGMRPWRELALYEMAWWEGLIIYHTWRHLTVAERAELGVMGTRSARRELGIR